MTPAQQQYLARYLNKEAAWFMDRPTLQAETQRIWDQDITPLAAAAGGSIAAVPVTNWLERMLRESIDPSYKASMQNLRQQVQQMLHQPGANAADAMRHLRTEGERFQELSRVAQSAQPWGFGKLPAKAGKSALIALAAALAYKGAHKVTGGTEQ
jgi:hypothetical protein